MWLRVKNKLKTHGWAIVLAILASLIVSAPTFLAPRAIDSEYNGVPFLFQDAETVYLTRIQEIADGHPTVASPVLHEYKDSQSIVPPIGEWIYFLLSRLTFTSLTTVVVASKFLFPTILFLLIYSLMFLTLESRLTALAAASLVVLGYDFVDVRSMISILGHLKNLPVRLSIWTRLVNPITGALFLMSYLIALKKLLNGSRLAPLAAAIFLALSIGYIFSFGIALASLTLFMLATAVLKEWPTLKKLAWVALGALLLDLVYFVGVFSTGASHNASDGLRNGLLLTHRPLLGAFLLLALILTLGGLFFDRYRHKRPSLRSPQMFFCLVLLGALAAMNQQVITGRTVWPEHFVQYTIPLSIMALFVFIFVYIKPFFPKAWRALPILAILISFGFSLLMVPTYKKALDPYRTANRYAAAFAWLDQSTKNGECVVLPAEELQGMMDYYITAFTHCDVYTSLYTFSSVPEERILHNYLVYLAFRGVKISEIEGYLQAHRSDLQIVFFRDWRDLFHGNGDKWLHSISDDQNIEAWLGELTKQIASDYRQFRSQSLKSELLKYRLDYVIWDRQTNPAWTPPLALKEVFRENEISLYTVN